MAWRLLASVIHKFVVISTKWLLLEPHVAQKNLIDSIRYCPNQQDDTHTLGNIKQSADEANISSLSPH